MFVKYGQIDTFVVSFEDKQDEGVVSESGGFEHFDILQLSPVSTAAQLESVADRFNARVLPSFEEFELFSRRCRSSQIFRQQPSGFSDPENR